MNTLQHWVVQFSQRERAFRVLQVQDLLRESYEYYYRFRDPAESDWMLVGIEQSCEKAYDTARQLKKSLGVPSSSDAT